MPGEGDGAAEGGGLCQKDADDGVPRQAAAARALDTSRVNSYLWLIRFMSLNNYVTYNVSEEELRSYEMDNPDLTVTVRYIPEDGGEEREPEAFTVHISRDAGTKAAMEEAAGERP